ncbi:MAG: carboxylesterase/lipase family protein [Bacteroidales bacterium]|nr:carboxylesterase/lipase family protein [Bacteroidales bacterium]
MITKHLMGLLAGMAICAGAFAQSGTTSNPGPVISSSKDAVTRTTNGPVIGYVDDGVYVFKGIPYAAAERFAPPTDPEPWTEVRMARVYGPACPQGSNLVWRGQNDYEFAFRYTKEVFDEKDMFTVNVFTKGLQDGKKRPVFVWFHGGGFSSGSAINLACYEGTSLAKKGDIVVVTVNHRLNCLGFLDLSSLGERYKYSANTGVMDMVKSLEWIRDNIEYFGGDPSAVTIAGQSGGGGKVQTLMVTPSAKGLFHRAIVQSGPYGAGHMMAKKAAQDYGKRVAAALGLDAGNIDKILTVPYEELSEAARKAGMANGGRFMDGPTCGDPTLPYDWFAPEADYLHKDIPLMIGSTFNELGHTLYYDVELTETQADEILSNRFGSAAPEFKKEFFKAYPGMTINDMVSIDINTRKSTIVVADKKYNIGGAPVYMYQFRWKSPVLDGKFGATHNMDLPFMFNNIFLQRELTGSTPDAYQLADRMSAAWIAFTRSGDPNNSSLPSWPKYDPSKRNIMVFDKKCESLSNHDRKLLDIAPEKGMF